MMRFGASTVVLSPEGWEDRIHTLADAGVEVVELSAAFGPDFGKQAGGEEGARPPGASAFPTFDYTDPYAIERAGRALRETGLALHSVHGPVFPPSAEETAGGAVRGQVERQLDALLESLFACVDACAALGGRFVTTQDAIGERGVGPETPCLASRPYLSRLAEYASRHGCVFALENGAEDEGGFRRIVETVRGLAHPGLGICLDLGHAQVWNYRDVPRAVREAGTLIRTCHVHDSLGTSDDHLPAGDGIIPWAAVLGELERAGYRGPLIMELHSGGPPALERSMEFLAGTAGPYWRRAAEATGYEVFPATEADRARARSVFGEAAVASCGCGRAAVVVDCFGDVVGWCEKPEGGKPRQTLAPGARGAAVGRACRELLS